MGIKIHRAIGWGLTWRDFHTNVRLNDTPTSSQYSDDWFMFFEDRLEERSEMMEFIGNGDDVSHVIFWPSIAWKGDWRRQDDPIDYAFERGGADGRGDVPAARMEFLDTAHHPFGHLYMDDQGNNLVPPRYEDYLWPDGGERSDKSYYPDFDAYQALCRKSLPGIPNDLRKWVSKAGLLDQTGIALLRPLRAQWWC